MNSFKVIKNAWELERNRQRELEDKYTQLQSADEDMGVFWE